MNLQKGRKAIDDYRRVHLETKTHPIKKLKKDLKDAGFEGIDEFFKFNDKECEDAVEVVGECNSCGKCCVGCEHRKNGKCEIYEDRPQMCKDYPPKKMLLDKSIPKECSYSLKINKDFDVYWK